MIRCPPPFILPSSVLLRPAAPRTTALRTAGVIFSSLGGGRVLVRSFFPHVIPLLCRLYRSPSSQPCSRDAGTQAESKSAGWHVALSCGLAESVHVHSG